MLPRVAAGYCHRHAGRYQYKFVNEGTSIVRDIITKRKTTDSPNRLCDCDVLKRMLLEELQARHSAKCMNFLFMGYQIIHHIIFLQMLCLFLVAAILSGVDAFAGFRSTFTRSSNAIYMSSLSQDELKKMVGYKAVDDYVQSGMAVGLGTGSTAFFAVERIGQKIKSGELKDIVCVPSSERTKEQALSLGIPLVTLNERSKLDVSIDGADDVDPYLNLVKGAGGSLLRDKMVYLPIVSQKFICIVDESKLSKGLGPGAPLPVEIATFCCEHTRRLIESLPSLKGCRAVLRMGDVSNNKLDGPEIAVTDNGNYIVDLFFNAPLLDAELAAKELINTAGVLEHGIFTGMTYALIVAGKDGVRVAGEGQEKPWW